MPIYCNDREIILKSNPELDDPVEAFYRKHKEKIQKLTDYVVIKKYESQSKFLYDDLGRPLRPTINTVPLKSIYRGDRGQETWTFGNTRKKNKNDTYSYDPSHVFVSDELQLDPVADIDKIFVLTVVGDVGKSGCYVYDPIKEAEMKASKVGGEDLDVKFLIYKNPDMTNEDLILLAQAWGLSNAESVNPTVLRNKLFDIVAAAEKTKENTGRGFSTFITDARNLNSANRDRVENKAILNKAITDGLVVFNAKVSQWFYKSGGDYICQVPRDKLDRKNEILMDYFHRKRDEWEAIKTDVWSEKEVPVYSIADIEKMATDKELRIAGKHMKVYLAPRDKTEVMKKKLMDAITNPVS